MSWLGDAEESKFARTPVTPPLYEDEGDGRPRAFKSKRKKTKTEIDGDLEIEKNRKRPDADARRRNEVSEEVEHLLVFGKWGGCRRQVSLSNSYIDI